MTEPKATNNPDTGTDTKTGTGTGTGIGIGARRPTSPFRLISLIDQRRRSFPLFEGVNGIGSRADNDVPIQAPGISRRHAEIENRGQRLVITDLGSKNGTSVNGATVETATLRLGDVVGICGVALKVDRLDPDDADLGVALSSVSPTAGPARTTQAKVVSLGGPPSAEALVGLIDRLVVCLFGMSKPDYAGALRHLLEATAGQAAALVIPRASGSLVLACVGAAQPEQLTAIESLKLVGAVGQTLRPEWPDATVTWSTENDEQICLWWAGGRQETWISKLLSAVVEWVRQARRRPDTSMSTSAVDGFQTDRDLVFPPGYLPGHSPAMTAVYSQMRYLTQGDVPVLIIGDTGVGKELLARTLHLSSARADGPLVAINCAAIPSELLEAELFGISKGVATGVSGRMGRIQQAHGGTLFLDEIGDMPAQLQAKLLRVLQEKEVQPVGGRPTPVDVRVVSATHNELSRAMDDGRFRRDLYYRLAGYVLRLPTLAERREDIPLLVEFFLRRFSHEIGKPIQGVTVKALNALCAYHWPGNIRELEHTVRGLAYLASSGSAIDSVLLSSEILGEPVEALSEDRSGTPSASASHTLGVTSGTTSTPDEHPSGSRLPTLDLAVLEKMAIEKAMAETDGVLTDAARILGISRDALRRRLTRHGVIRHGMRGDSE